MIILIGEGGGGKTAILRELEKRGFEKAINHTTRPVRQDENRFSEYKFLTKEEFNKMWNEGKLLQRAEFGGEYYGISIESLKENVACIAIVQSIKAIKDRAKELGIEDVNIVSFYVYVSEEERRRRMRHRGDSEEYIEKRLVKDREIFNDASKVASYVIINDDLNRAVEEIIEKSKK